MQPLVWSISLPNGQGKGGGGRLIGDKGEGDETGSRKVNMGGPTLVGW